MKEKAEKLDSFIWTYMRCFDEKDTRKVIRKNNVGKFIASLNNIPIPAAAILVMHNHYHILDGMAFVYQIPVYVMMYCGIRELLGNLQFRSQLRYKEKIYKKYHPLMDLTKEDVEKLEYDLQNRLRIEEKKNKK